MGVSLEVWRARIGLFVGVMRSKSCLQRVWPHGKRRRTYQVPPKPPRKHHVPILICFLALAVLSAIDGQNPGQTFRHGGRGCVVVISAAAWFAGTCFLEIEKWRNRLTLGLLILLVSLLLTCGDVESNPGPKGAKPKKTYKVRSEGKTPFGTSASSIVDIWCRTSQKWGITSDDYILCEEDGTEFEDDDYFQGLPNGSVVIVRCKSTNQKDDHQHLRPITHKMINDIAVNHLPSDITDLGLAMGFTRVVIEKYQTENNENLPRSKGTERMIHRWIDGDQQRNNVDAFCSVLREAELHDLADKIKNGDSLSVKRPTIISDVLELENLQKELRLHYRHRLGYMKMIPWREDSACSVEDYFIPMSLFRRVKVPRRANADTGQFDSSEPVSHDDIFKIRENGEVCHRILVSGKPGIGKTTLSSKLAYDWANRAEQSPLRDVHLLFVLSLSSVDIGRDIGEEVVKQLLPDDTTTTASQINHYIQTHQEDVVLIFDGLDESVLLNESLNETRHVGNIMKSVKYEVLCSCQILVTTRPWLEDELLSNLFTVYAHIQINGFTMTSINEFVDRYCQSRPRLAENVKEKISVDLHNLSHLFHVPLFLAMLCEMVRAEMDISACDTLTSFIEQVCLYLFTSYNSKPNCKSFLQKPLDENEMRECLRALGEIAIQGRTASDNVQFERGLAIGLLTLKSVFGDQKIKGLQIPEKSTVFYFCHGLLKDFCISHYLSSLPEPNLNSYIEKSLRGFGVFTFRYIMLFLCGLNQRVVVMMFNHLIEAMSQDDIYKEFATQCYFEGKIGNKGVNMDILSFPKRLVIDVCLLNSFQAAKYLLSSKGSNSFGINELLILGENIADSNIGDATYSMTPVLNHDRLSNIYIRCSNLISIGLYDLMFREDAFQEETKLSRSNFKIADIAVRSCKDETLLQNLLKTMLFHLPSLEQVEMVNISNPHSVRKCKQIGIEFVFNFFAKFSCPLNSVQGDCIEMSEHASDGDSKEWPLVKSVSLRKCGCVIPLHQNIASLGRRCPLLTVLEICFSTYHNKCLNIQTKHLSTDCISFKEIVLLISVHCPKVTTLHLADYNFDVIKSLPKLPQRNKSVQNIVIDHCEQLVIFPRTVAFLSAYFSSLKILTIANSKISFEDTESLPAGLNQSFEPKTYHSLQCLQLENLTQPVNFVHLIDNLYRHCPSLVEVHIHDSDLINDEDVTDILTTVAKPNPCFEKVHLLRCKKPIHLARTFQPMGYLIPTSVKFRVEECEINLQGIASEFTEINSHLSRHFLTLSQCKEPVNLSRTLGILCHYCHPILRLCILQPKISFDPVFFHTKYISHHSLKEMHLSDCKLPINILGIIDLMCYCCSSLVCLLILDSKISLKDLRPALAQTLHQSLKEIHISHVEPTRVDYARKLLRHRCPSLERVKINGLMVLY